MWQKPRLRMPGKERNASLTCFSRAEFLVTEATESLPADLTIPRARSPDAGIGAATEWALDAFSFVFVAIGAICRILLHHAHWFPPM